MADHLQRGFSTANYTSLLVNLASQAALPANIVMSVGPHYLTEAEAARQSLVDDFGWQIEDAGKICLNDQDCDGLFDADECDGGTGTSSVLRVDDIDCDGVPVESDSNDDDPSVRRNASKLRR